jgi:hypothetical protein
VVIGAVDTNLARLLLAVKFDPLEENVTAMEEVADRVPPG